MSRSDTPCSPRGQTVRMRFVVMSLATSIGRALDRSGTALMLMLGLALAAGTALVGA